jgi:flagellar motility protein MotE (MotC chaperone)
MGNKEVSKPDFGDMAKKYAAQFPEQMNIRKHAEVDYEHACEKIWNDYVLPLTSQLEEAKKEIDKWNSEYSVIFESHSKLESELEEAKKEQERSRKASGHYLLNIVELKKENERARELLKGSFELAQCGHAHNYPRKEWPLGLEIESFLKEKN